MIRFYLEGTQLLETEPNKILATVLSSIKDIKWWSTDAIYEFIDGTIEQIKIYASERRKELEKDKHSNKSDKTRLTRFINRDMLIPKSREKLLPFYYKLILSNEKKGLLTGFGMEGSLSNPEY